MVTTSRCDLERLTRQRLATHIAEIGKCGDIVGHGVGRRCGPSRFPLQCFDDVAQRAADKHTTLADDLGLMPTCRGHNGLHPTERGDHGGRASNGAQRPIETEFGDESEVGDSLGCDELVGHEHAHGNRQVEA